MNKRILIVEENKIDGESALDAISQLGLKADLVTNPKEAQEKIEQEKYLAVIADLGEPMDNVDNIIVNPKIREDFIIFCANKRLPIFIITGKFYDKEKADTANIELLFSYNVYHHQNLKNKQPILELIHKIQGIKCTTTYKKMWEKITKDFFILLDQRSREIKNSN